MKVSNEKTRRILSDPTLYTLYINCSPEVNVMIDKHFEIKPDYETKIKFIELIEFRNIYIYGKPVSVKSILDFLEENKDAFKKHINLFNDILCLKSHLTDEDIKTDTPSSHIYFYDLSESPKLKTIKMMEEISYIFYHNTKFE